MRLSLEFKKSILMIFLLLLCVLQMGILWVDKSPGVSIFSSQRFWPKTENIKVEEVKKNYIHPGRIIVSDGTEVYWPLEPDNAFYSAIWNGFTGSYLKQILEQSAADNVYTPTGIPYKKKCVIVEFKCSVPVGILQWLTGTEKPAMTPFKEISKVAIIPDSLNHNEIILYLTEDGVNVYEYIVNIEQGSIRKEDYYYLLDTIRDNETIIPLRTFGSLYPGIENGELLAVLSEDKELKMIRDLRVTTPDEIVLRQDNIDRIQEYLIESSSTYTAPSKDGTSVLFSDDEKIVYYYDNGFFDYRYRTWTGPKGAAEEALEQALTFIEYRRKNLELDSGIYLTDIVSTNPNYYVFTFNYFMYGMEIKVLDEKGKTIKPSIRIIANRERVLDAKWYIKTFSDNDFAKNYDLNFINFYENKLVSEYPQFNIDFQPQHISTDYLFSGMRVNPTGWLKLIKGDLPENGARGE